MINKEIVIKILTTNNADITDLNTFVTEYIHEKLNKDVTVEELKIIVQLIQQGQFNLQFALFEAARILGLNILTILDKHGNLLKVEVYESF